MATRVGQVLRLDSARRDAEDVRMGLSDDEVRAGLIDLPGWRREGDEIVRDYECPTFPEAIAFVTRIADLAEAADHHPDIDIRYSKLRVALTTHDAGGLTQKDLDLARAIETAAPPAS
jgi:4a-hydroxytetrahydrobiopterin dehydratase